MGFSEKVQVGGGQEPEGKTWVITGISLRVHLRPINTNPLEKGKENEEEEIPTTPTSEEARIPESLPCPPAPKKRKPISKCHFSGVREFFSPPDLESVFIPRVERAK